MRGRSRPCAPRRAATASSCAAPRCRRSATPGRRAGNPRPGTPALDLGREEASARASAAMRGPSRQTTTGWSPARPRAPHRARRSATTRPSAPSATPESVSARPGPAARRDARNAHRLHGAMDGRRHSAGTAPFGARRHSAAGDPGEQSRSGTSMASAERSAVGHRSMSAQHRRSAGDQVPSASRDARRGTAAAPSRSSPLELMINPSAPRLRAAGSASEPIATYAFEVASRGCALSRARPETRSPRRSESALVESRAARIGMRMLQLLTANCPPRCRPPSGSRRMS